MKKLENFEQVEAVQGGGFKRLPAGGYICRITKVEDVPEKEYIKMEYDIMEGDYRLWWSDLQDKAGFWGGKLFKSYKNNDTILKFFKGFITSLEESNPKFKWDWDESKLQGLSIGLVLGEEEYIGNDESVKTRMNVVQNLSVDSIKKGNFEVPPLKQLPASQIPPVVASTDIADDDLPF